MSSFLVILVGLYRLLCISDEGLSVAWGKEAHLTGPSCTETICGHKDKKFMNVPLIIKQVCQQLRLMEVMQRGSGPERGPVGLGG